MQNFKILDCTLRDGGYYTKWDFEKDLVNTYFESLNGLPIDYIEIGYRSAPMKEYHGQFFYCPIHLLEEIRSISKKKIAIIINEKDFKENDIQTLLTPISGLVDMIRIAVDPDNFVRSISLAQSIHQLGFEISYNLMYMSKWKNYPNLAEDICKIENIVDYLYMVDSFGGVYPKDIVDTIKMIRSKSKIKLGFHGHNNLELALINSLTAIENGVEMIDATITGMGRGAGNLKMELLLTVLNSNQKFDLDFNILSNVTDRFTKLQELHMWGTNLPYMLSGAHSLPQKKVMEWVSKRLYSMNSILRALNNQSKGIEDNESLPVFKLQNNTQLEKVLIIGGGPTVNSNYKSIEKFLEINENIILVHSSSRNAMCFKNLVNKQFFCLVGNEGYRLENIFGNVENLNGECILPPFPRVMGTYIPSKLKDKAYQLEKVSFTGKLSDTHTALAIQTAFELGAKEVYVVGYDGYSGINIGQKEQDYILENEYLFKKAKENGLELISLTDTKYENLKKDSLFAHLI